MPIIWTYDGIENKYDIYGGKDCMKKFCEFIRRHTIKIINLEKKTIPLIKEQQESYEKTKICYHCKKKVWMI